MGNTIDRNQVVWIVIATNHCWGADNSLHKALQNANLPEKFTPTEWFAEELEYRFDLEEAIKNWNDYGKEDSKTGTGDTHGVVIYKFDPAIWKDFSISEIDGSVGFYPNEYVELDWKAEMEKAKIVANYKDGVLSPVKS
jgi:hypothetical protein